MATGNPIQFKLPKDGAIYTEEVLGRCRDLISFGLWTGIEPFRLDQWVRNFVSDEERYFCAKVLDFLIYRSDPQMIAGLKEIFQVILPQIGFDHGIGVLGNAFAQLKSETDHGIRLVPVIPRNAPPTKSGNALGRLLKRKLRINESWIMTPEQLCANGRSAKAVVFFDDFLGTGEQFTKFYNDYKFPSLFSSTKFAYVPLVANQGAMSDLMSLFPELYVYSSEVLNSSHSFFSPDCPAFKDGTNSPFTAIEFYHDLLVKKQIDVYGADRQGFGGMEFLVAFGNAVPDNSLPILWWNESQNWKPLFDR